LAQLLIDKPNMLLLDEPTNHLDINSCEALERALRDFPGTILCVSHDRYFLDQLAQRLLVLDPPGIVDFSGNYTAWTAAQKAAAQAQKQPVKSPPKPAEKKKENTGPRPYSRLGVKELEREINQTEIALADCQKRVSDTKRGRQNKIDCENIAKKLAELEQEYFTRGQ
jgi:ATP-binding cassette subfamily F protein 3